MDKLSSYIYTRRKVRLEPRHNVSFVT